MVANMQQQAARLARLERVVGEGGGGGGEGSPELGETIREGAQEVVEAAFDELAGRINQVEGQVGKLRQPEAADLAYFRNKTEEIETALADLKRLLLKVQSFSMETNCAMLKLGARVEKQEDDLSRRSRAEAATTQADEQAREKWQRTIEERIQETVEAQVGQLSASLCRDPQPAVEGEEGASAEEEADTDGGADTDGEGATLEEG